MYIISSVVIVHQVDAASDRYSRCPAPQVCMGSDLKGGHMTSTRIDEMPAPTLFANRLGGNRLKREKHTKWGRMCFVCCTLYMANINAISTASAPLRIYYQYLVKHIFSVTLCRHLIFILRLSGPLYTIICILSTMVLTQSNERKYF